MGDVLNTNVNNQGAYGPITLTDDYPLEVQIPADSPVPVPDVPPINAPITITDNSRISPVTNVSSVTNINPAAGAFGKKTEWGVDLDLSAAFGGGVASHGGQILQGAFAGNAIFAVDAEDTTAGAADVNCRIWIRFDNKQVWWPVRGGFELTGFPFQTVYAKWDAQASKKMYLRGWTDVPVDRVDAES